MTLIRDGEVLWDEINDLGSNETWLKSELHTQNITDYKDVFLQNGLKETDFLYRL
ncbi:YetF domain-containing protein [Neobacillus cucumis]|uniref:YetF domain-containing protein n=1 Tax=Neobacillus cucumis TaxID=1740721 RepID=UPI003557C993